VTDDADRSDPATPNGSGTGSTSGGPGPGAEPFDWAAIATGAALTLLFAVPADLVKRDLSSGSSWNGLFFAIVLGAFGLGGAVAGRTSQRRYLTVGAVTGLGAIAIYLVVGLAARAATGTDVRVTSLVFTALLGMCCGMLGADIGARWRRRHAQGAAS
jgi:putative membrane protein (TIGR04086 family)